MDERSDAYNRREGDSATAATVGLGHNSKRSTSGPLFAHRLGDGPKKWHVPQLLD